MQSLARKFESARLKTPRFNRLSSIASVQPCQFNRVSSTAAAARQVADRRTDAAREHEAGRRSRGGGDRQLAAEPSPDVYGGGQLGVELPICLGELRALGLERLLDLCVGAGALAHQRCNLSFVSCASRIACSGTGGVPRLISPSAITPRSAAPQP